VEAGTFVRAGQSSQAAPEGERSYQIRRTHDAIEVFAVLLALHTLTAAELVIHNAAIEPGHSKDVEIEFKGDDSQATGLQFDLTFEADRLKITGAAGPSAASVSKGVVTSPIGPGAIRFIVAGLNREAIPDGVVVRVTVTVETSSKLGDSALGISNAKGT
jgi:hypothetical protein